MSGLTFTRTRTLKDILPNISHASFVATVKHAANLQASKSPKTRTSDTSAMVQRIVQGAYESWWLGNVDSRQNPKVIFQAYTNLLPNRLASSTRFTAIEEACDASLTSRICEKRGNVDRYKQVNRPHLEKSSSRDKRKRTPAISSDATPT